MKKVMQIVTTIAVVLMLYSSAVALGIRITSTAGGTLEDVVLFASVDGDPPMDAIAVGDIDLSLTDHVVDVPVDAGLTHWWLIGHYSGNTVYSSGMNLEGVDMWSIAPYPWGAAGALVSNIPLLLEHFQSGGITSLDLYAATATNHNIHIAGNGWCSGLWVFDAPGPDTGYSSPGQAFGDVRVSLYSNWIPSTGCPSYNFADEGLIEPEDVPVEEIMPPSWPPPIVPAGCPTGQIEDCNGNCYPSSWVGDSICDDGTYGAVFTCSEFLNDGGDCGIAACPAGKVKDCNGNCYSVYWVGDDVCDDGTYGAVFTCADWNYDGGDCY